MKALYALEQSRGRPDHVIHTLLKPQLEADGETLEFGVNLFRATVDATEEVDEIIQKHATHWDLSRITVIDRSLLRMATTELLEFEEIPPKVSIDEAIEIAKTYSTPQSDTFINGVLDAILMDLERQDRLNKTGRGLIGIEAIRDRAQSS